MQKPEKLFFLAFALTALLCCLGECLLLRAIPSAVAYYRQYALFILCACFAVGLITLAVSAVVCRSDSIELRISRSRIADLERTLHSLEEDAEHREQFIASFAHELKTPLTAIIGYADMLRSKDMAPRTRFTAAGYIFSEGKRLEALSLKLMDIIVVGRQDFERRHMEPGFLIREVSAVAVPSVGGDGQILDIRWEKGDVEVEPDLFKTLLINLVDNARKASRKGQHVELYGRNEEGGYAFYIRDHGRGMAPEELSKITQPFYMIDKSRSRAQNGAGLGLALCQKIAELHGTRLEYSSRPGEGTTVRVFLKDGAA